MYFSGFNANDDELVVAMVQQQIALVRNRADLAEAVRATTATLAEIATGMPRVDLVVLPEYGLHGLRKEGWADDSLMCTIPGPETDLLTAACRRHSVWAAFSVMETNPHGAPFNSSILVDEHGEIVLHTRKLFPWSPKEPWEPGSDPLSVCSGPRGSTIGLLICHDGCFPEAARDLAYQGATVIVRQAGYKLPFEQAWRISNQANAFSNMAYTVSVCLAGDDGNGFPSLGGAMACDIDGSVLVEGDQTPGRVVTAAFSPARAEKARRTWGVENNIYQLGHRGYTAIREGLADNPFRYVTDLAAGQYRVPWDRDVSIRDGRSEGYGPAREPGTAADTARAGFPGSS
ncbi:formamidase [Gordonia sp. NB41Y]|uniref:formamidase n=1 Tax=Gordonia sp. NB41Y TaxID=875808 RepID=UPI0006B1C55C|nr:formamidase [Gordonia sp. NB41Y]EMP15154.2 formamidase [Gordonia sp. NB41Y]WLP92928.1 formamidase [Gordonia sp. NB41Y]